MLILKALQKYSLSRYISVYGKLVKVTSLGLFPTIEKVWQYHTLCCILKFVSTDRGHVSLANLSNWQ